MKSTKRLDFFGIVLPPVAITKRRQGLCSKLLLIPSRQLFMFDHKKGYNCCNSSKTRVNDEHQFEACCVAMREHITGRRRRQPQ